MTHHAPELRIELTKRTDGGVTFRAVRADGTATWQRQGGRQALFFPYHDLTHFAVETTLGFRQAFYGLLADGWEIGETEGKSARGPLPGDATLVEYIVGLLDTERVDGAAPLSAEEFNAHIERGVAAGRVASGRIFTDVELSAVRRRASALYNEWAALAPGATLALEFTRGNPIAARR